MQVFLSITIWIILGALTAHFAQQRGRDPYLWFAIGLLLGILGLLLVFILPSYEEKEDVEPPLAQVQHPEFLPKGYKTLDWYYLLDGQEQIGPVPFAKIEELTKTLEEDFYVWCDGMDDWMRISEVRRELPSSDF